MNLVLTYCWREWRAQRAMLTGFFGLGIAALCLVFSLVPEHYWLDDGRRALALSWFVVLGGIGVLGFVAPALVRSEFGTIGDQFVRRMPGALRASFGGKLLFLLLATIALPLLGLAAGELFLTANGKGWHDLFRWTFAGDVVFDVPWPALWIALAALLIPWVWAIGTWLPNGRMALGGAVVLWLVLGACARAAVSFTPGLLPQLAYEPWIAAASALGFVVAFVSWTVGRRGGGALRSARCGLMATSLGLLPPLLWLGERVYDYHHPDPRCVERMDVNGISPDHRYVLVRLQSQASYQYTLPFRIDLQDGSATQLHGVGLDLRPDLLRPTTFMLMGEARYFGGYECSLWPERLCGYRVFDLQAGTWLAAAQNSDPKAMRAEALKAVRERLAPQDHGPALFAPDGVRAWFDGGELCFSPPDGRGERVRWNGELPVTLRARGHGFVAWGKPEQWFDLTTRTAMRPDDERDVVFFVRGTQLVQRHRRSGVWLRRDPGSEAFVEVPALGNADLLGLVDDERVLCSRQSKHSCELFVWRPVDGAVQSIATPGPSGLRSLGVAAPMRQQGSLLPRAPDGSLWLTVFDPNREGMRFLRWDPATTMATALPFASSERYALLLAWPDANSVLLQEGTTIQHIDMATGHRTQRFPVLR
ncbi:MAG: hypothetical protein ACK501_09720 [Planctomycetota bacterium]|jgi:hypothetical protein